MKMIEGLVRDHFGSDFKENPDAGEARQYFEAVHEKLRQALRPCSHDRRYGQMSWRTIHKLRRKRPREEASQDPWQDEERENETDHSI